MSSHSNVLSWKTSWTEEHGRLGRSLGQTCLLMLKSLAERLEVVGAHPGDVDATAAIVWSSSTMRMLVL